MTKRESEIVMDMLGTCENPRDVEVLTALQTTTGEHKFEPAVEPGSSVYGSCEEAESAGGAEDAGKQGRRPGVPEGDGPECKRRGQ